MKYEWILNKIYKLKEKFIKKYDREPNAVILPKNIYDVLNTTYQYLNRIFTARWSKFIEEPENKTTILGLWVCLIKDGEMEVVELL